MQQNKPEIGDTVTRIAKDYTGGRVGKIIELDEVKGRARIAWEFEADGRPMKLRTWIRFGDFRRVIGGAQ